MGQQIEVQQRTVVDRVLLVTTDRSLTGQDGAAFSSAAAAVEGTGFGAGLAARLFAGDDAIDHVYVASNELVVQRDGGWDDQSADDASIVVAEFLRFYPE
jgi:hypothetical protein